MIRRRPLSSLAVCRGPSGLLRFLNLLAVRCRPLSSFAVRRGLSGLLSVCRRPLIYGPRAVRCRLLVLLALLCWAAVLPASAAKPCRRGYLPVPQGRLYYECFGEGEPLVFVHGHSLDRRMWREQVARFADRYRVIVYDARGYGRSSAQREGELFTHADDLVALLDGLGIERAHVVGLSMGGFITGDLVAMYPERLLSATLSSGHIRSTPSVNEPMTADEIAAKERSIAAVRRQGVRRMKREWHERLMSTGGSERERMRRPLWRMIRSWSAWQPLHHEVHCYYAREAMSRLQETQPALPVLFLEGREPDREPPAAPAMMRFLPASRLVVIEDCGHMLNMERPEAYNEALAAFLSSLE